MMAKAGARIGWLGSDGGEVLEDEISNNICEASNTSPPSNSG